MLSQRPWDTAVGTPSRRLNGYPRTKSVPSRYGSYRVLKKMEWMEPEGSFCAAEEH
ncbi:hypothetical protein NC651_033724 [Populus alba x Populus x berolinensis]|nr:hypothetical protein NC651_033724 [Populus alba x Populus x berolinensis]